MTTTAWGKATVKEQVLIKQSSPRGELGTIVELLTNENGETMVRFAYSTGGAARRGPVTLRAADLQKLRKALEKTPELAAALATSMGARDRKGARDP